MNKDKKTGTSFECKTVNEFAEKVVSNFYENEIIGSIKANEKGFIQIKVNDKFVEEKINEMVQDLIFPEIPKQKIVVDFSSPNIAK
jgi:arginyl-tRNA synthetase